LVFNKEEKMSKLVKLFVALTFLVGVSCSNGALLNDNQTIVDEDIAVVDQSASSSGTDIPYNGSNGDVMLQAFHWNSKNGKNSKTWYDYLYSVRTKLRTYYNVIYLPPPSQSADGYGYMPSDWANLSSNYGTQASLKSLITALHASPKKYVLADVVLNHRSAKSQCPHGVWCGYGYAANAMTSSDFINGSYDQVSDSGAKSCGTCMTSGYSEGSWSYGGRTYYNEDFTGSCDVNHWNSSTRTKIKTWLTWLKSSTNAGFDGWRYDMIGGYDPLYLGEYNTSSSPYLSVGEKPSGDRQMLSDMVNRSGNKTMVFDFAMRDSLYSALASVNNMYGNYLGSVGANTNYGLIGWWSEAAVTFIHNHDIDLNHHSVGRNTMLWGVSGSAKGVSTQAAYAFILTHPGIPCVFIQDWEDRGTYLTKAINNLIKIRKANGVQKGSRVYVAKAENGIYAAYIGTEGAEQVAIKIGKTGWNNYESWTPNSALGLTKAYTQYETGGHAYCVYYKNAVTIE